MIAIGCDHAGFELKQHIMNFLQENGYVVEDYGTHTLEEPVDYPEYALKVAQAVSSSQCEKGIIVCGSGIGVSMVANKVKGIRAALCTDSYMAKMSREHNDANVLALGERVIGKGLAQEIVEIWLATAFAGGKHGERIEQISHIELA